MYVSHTLIETMTCKSPRQYFCEGIPLMELLGSFLVMQRLRHALLMLVDLKWPVIAAVQAGTQHNSNTGSLSTSKIRGPPLIIEKTMSSILQNFLIIFMELIHNLHNIYQLIRIIKNLWPLFIQLLRKKNRKRTEKSKKTKQSSFTIEGDRIQKTETEIIEKEIQEIF